MSRSLCLVSIAISIVCAPARAGPPSVDAKLRSEVAAEIAGINAQDPAKATAYEARDMMFSECGRFATFGRESYRQGLSMTFKREPAWHLSLIYKGSRSRRPAIRQSMLQPKVEAASAMQMACGAFIGRSFAGSLRRTKRTADPVCAAVSVGC